MKEYILEVKKIIPSDICKKIISYFDNNSEDASTTGSGVNKNIRNCTTRSLFENKIENCRISLDTFATKRVNSTSFNLILRKGGALHVQPGLHT